MPRPTLLVLLLVLPGLAIAQPPSHLNDLDQPALKDLSKVLGNKAQPSTKFDTDLLRKLLKDIPANIDPKKFDPKLAEQILKNNPELRNPENLERLKSLVQDQLKNPPATTDPMQDLRKLEGTLRNLGEFGKKNPPPNQPLPPQPEPEQPQLPPQNRPSDEQTQRRLDELSKFATRALGDSSMTREIVKDFAELMNKEGVSGELSALLNGIGQEWKSLGGPGAPPSALNNLLAGLKLPDVGSSGSAAGGMNGRPSVPETSDSPGSSGESSTAPTILLMIGIGVLVVILLWRKLGGAKDGEDSEVNCLQLDGDLDPHEVKTREDVVKVFDHLSLVRLGDEAANWHHRQIGGGLAEQVPGQRDAVERLVNLYEKARYAPGRDIFTEREIAEARERLCQMAKGAAK